MSMMQKEVIKTIEFAKTYISKDGMIKQALDLAISALRPVSREQVEKVWRGSGLDVTGTVEDFAVSKVLTTWANSTRSRLTSGASMEIYTVPSVGSKAQTIF